MSQDATQQAGLFAEQMRDLGFEATAQEDWVFFPFVVPGGTHEGATVNMAIQVPPDFPLSAPSGIDFEPRFTNRPLNPGGEHPQRSHASRRFGEGGEYWSRPHLRWAEEKTKDARAYLAWVRNLWMTT